MKINYFIYLLGIVCLLSTCDNIEGTYVSNYNVVSRDSIGTDTVRMFSNHKYKRICYPHKCERIDYLNTHPDTTYYIDTGSWELSKGDIIFRSWYGRNELDHASGEVIFITEIDRSFFIGTRRMLIDDDMGYYYMKINDNDSQK